MPLGFPSRSCTPKSTPKKSLRPFQDARDLATPPSLALGNRLTSAPPFSGCGGGICPQRCSWLRPLASQTPPLICLPSPPPPPPWEVAPSPCNLTRSPGTKKFPARTTPPFPRAVPKLRWLPESPLVQALPFTWIQLETVFVLKALPGDGDHELPQEIAVLGVREGGVGMEGEDPAQASPAALPPTCILR